MGLLTKMLPLHAVTTIYNIYRSPGIGLEHMMEIENVCETIYLNTTHKVSNWLIGNHPKQNSN